MTTVRKQINRILARGMIAVATGIGFVAPASMAGDDPQVEEIVVETRLGDDGFGIGEAVSYDRTDHLRIRPVDAEQVFQMLPGFSVSRPGGPGGVSEIFLRGAESNFTAVYVDGIRLNNPSNTRGGSFDFSMLSAHEIDRVDVAAGTMSAVYGADAMAGVIHIRTAWADPGAQSVFLEAGSVHDWRAGAGVTFQLGNDVDWSIRASTLDGGDEIEGSSLNLDSLATRLAGRWVGSGSWEVNLRRVQRERSSFPEVSGGPKFAVSRELETADGDELSIAAIGSWSVTDAWRSEISISGSQIRDNVAVPAVAPGMIDGQPAFSTITRYDRRQLLWVNRMDLPMALDAVSGIDFVAEDASDGGAVDLGYALVPNTYEMQRSLASVFTEIGKLWDGGFAATLAVRWDHAGVDGRLSGKLGVARALTDSGSRIWAHIGDGFKLPSFFALGNPLFGNVDLVAEKVRSAEAGYTHVSDVGSELIVLAFRSRYDDLVDFDFESFTNVNRGRIDASGVQVRASLEPTPGIRLLLDGTWSHMTGGAEPLRRRPERMGGISLDFSPAARWRVNATIRYVGARLMTSIPTGDVDAAGYSIVRANARYEHSSNRAFWIVIDNALDANYQDAPGFPSQGPRMRIGMNQVF